MGDSWKEVEARVRGRSSWWKTGVQSRKHVFGEGAGECSVLRRASSGEGFYVSKHIHELKKCVKRSLLWGPTSPNTPLRKAVTPQIRTPLFSREERPLICMCWKLL